MTWLNRILDVAYLLDSSVADVWKVLQINITSSRSWSLISRVSKNLLATRSNASSGHGYKEQTCTLKGEQVAAKYIDCSSVPCCIHYILHFIYYC